MIFEDSPTTRVSSNANVHNQFSDSGHMHAERKSGIHSRKEHIRAHLPKQRHLHAIKYLAFNLS